AIGEVGERGGREQELDRAARALHVRLAGARVQAVAELRVPLARPRELVAGPVELGGDLIVGVLRVEQAGRDGRCPGLDRLDDLVLVSDLALELLQASLRPVELTLDIGPRARRRDQPEERERGGRADQPAPDGARASPVRSHVGDLAIERGAEMSTAAPAPRAPSGRPFQPSPSSPCPEDLSADPPTRARVARERYSSVPGRPRSRAIRIRWISLVPSPISSTFASR